MAGGIEERDAQILKGYNAPLGAELVITDNPAMPGERALAYISGPFRPTAHAMRYRRGEFGWYEVVTQ